MCVLQHYHRMQTVSRSWVKCHTHLIVVNCGSRKRLKERAASHCKSANHRMKEKDSRQPSARTSFAKLSGNQNTWKELVEALVTADVPLHKLDNEKLRKVLESKFGQIPSRTTLRDSIVPQIYDSKVTAFKQLLSDTPVVFMLDETRDTQGRNVLNILCGRLDGSKPNTMLVILSEYVLSMEPQITTIISCRLYRANRQQSCFSGSRESRD